MFVYKVQILFGNVEKDVDWNRYMSINVILLPIIRLAKCDQLTFTCYIEHRTRGPE